jgi:GNAT superfamily N-acetyltransferase
MAVRRVLPGEEDRLRYLRLRALAADPQAFARSREEEAELPHEHWATLASSGERAVFVDEDFQGMAGAVHRGDDVELWGMWVDPSARGTGLARELVEAVCDWAAERGVPHVQLGVYEDAGVSAFYEKLGFAEVDVPTACDRTFRRAVSR